MKAPTFFLVCGLNARFMPNLIYIYIGLGVSYVEDTSCR
jgi:hypothetical protein